MTVSLSIFDKICPSCAARLSVSAETCLCGHRFKSEQETSEQEAALNDEEIYEGYLAARADQANEAARVARQALYDDPASPDLQAAADLASEVAKSLAADLAEQRAKIALLRSKLPAVTAPPPVVAVPVAAVPPPPIKSPTTVGKRKPTPAATSVRVPEKTVAAVPVVVPVAHPEKTNISPEPAIKSTPVATPPVMSSIPRSTPLSSTANAASVLEAIKNANARERAMRNPVPVDTVSGNTTAPAAFRAEQSLRAEKAMNEIPAHAGKDCPNCTSNVPVNTTRCRCGFQFEPSSNDLPSLTLCTGDFSALRDSLNLNLRRS